VTDAPKRPCSAAEAVQRARELLASPLNASAAYVLGGGDYRPGWTSPWTTHGSLHGGDCRVAFLWCYRVPASRPGYNHGAWATVSDCVNYNSLIEDSDHAQDLVVPALGAPQEGDILAYPTIHLDGKTFIGHGAIVIGVSRAVGWDPGRPQFHLLDIMQVKGGEGRRPAAVATDGSVFDHHSELWPKPQHCARLLRVKP
jgi:hypothetical protein